MVAAAIKESGMVCSVPRPGRHHDVIRAMARSGIPIPINGEQGFLLSNGRFVGREHAMKIAIFADQLKPPVGPDGVPFKRSAKELFSEDLW